MARKIVRPSSFGSKVQRAAQIERNERTHGLRKFVFRQVLIGRTLKPSNQALCIEITDVVAARTVLGGHATNTQEMRRFRDSRFADQPAEYSAHTVAGAIAQFEADFPKFKVLS